MNQQYGIRNIKKGPAAAAVALIFGLSIASGGGAAFAMETGAATGQSGTSAQHTNESQKAADLRVAMNNLLREHVTSSLSVTRNIAGGASERQIEASKEAQMANSDAIAAAVGSIYGGEAQAQFSTLFREHIGASNQYAKAIAEGDRTAADAAAAELRKYLTDIATFFSAAVPGLPTQDVYGLLNEHEELLNKSVDAYKAGDFVQSYQMEREALKQISRAADVLSSGSAAANPTKF